MERHIFVGKSTQANTTEPQHLSKSRKIMERNPFCLSPLIPDEYFCDRHKETELMLKTLTNQGNVVLTSPRRMGKTGLINHCFSQPVVRQNFIAISIDVLHTSSLREFVMELGSAVFKTVASRSERLTKQFVSVLRSLSASFGFDAMTGMPTFDIKLGQITSPEYTLDEIFSYLEAAGMPCLVAIDEFQQIVYYPEKNTEALLRGRIQRLHNTNFVFAGSERRMMNEMFFSDLRPFYQSATPIELAPIELDVYTKFAQAMFARADKRIGANVVENIYRFWDGVTMYVHRLLHDAYAETDSGEECEQALVDRVTEQYLQQNDKRLLELLAFVSEQQKELLYAICAEGQVQGITSAAFVKRHSLKSASAVQSAAKRLLEIDMITKQGYVYSVSDPLMRIWLRRRMSV